MVDAFTCCLPAQNGMDIGITLCVVSRDEATIEASITRELSLSVPVGNENQSFHTLVNAEARQSTPRHHASRHHSSTHPRQCSVQLNGRQPSSSQQGGTGSTTTRANADVFFLHN